MTKAVLKPSSKDALNILAILKENLLSLADNIEPRVKGLVVGLETELKISGQGGIIRLKILITGVYLSREPIVELHTFEPITPEELEDLLDITIPEDAWELYNLRVYGHALSLLCRDAIESVKVRLNKRTNRFSLTVTFKGKSRKKLIRRISFPEDLVVSYFGPTD